MEPFVIFKGTLLMVLAVAIPGAALTYGIFPKKDQLDLAERLGLSFILGFVPQFLLYFADKNFNLPITGTTTFLTIALVTAVGLALWKFRK